MKTFITQIFFCCIIACPFLIYANNIQVANVSLENQNWVDQYIYIEFDLSWENTWRTSSVPGNWDAAWVFVKYQIDGIGGALENFWNLPSISTTCHSIEGSQLLS